MQPSTAAGTCFTVLRNNDQKFKGPEVVMISGLFYLYVGKSQLSEAIVKVFY